MNRKTFGALGLFFALILALGIQGDVSAASLTANIKLIVTADFTSSGDLVTSKSDLRQQYALSLASGVAGDQADMVWSDQRTVALSTTEDLDVDAGGLTDVFGTTFTLVKLKVLVVCAASGNTNTVDVGGDANSVPFFAAFADFVSVHPGGCLVLTNPALAGYAVTAGTGDIIQIANGGAGTSVTYDIVIIGTSS